jgi:hypothetical protein
MLHFFVLKHAVKNKNAILTMSSFYCFVGNFALI